MKDVSYYLIFLKASTGNSDRRGRKVVYNGPPRSNLLTKNLLTYKPRIKNYPPPPPLLQNNQNFNNVKDKRQLKGQTQGFQLQTCVCHEGHE
jgi:hypothetical protein